MGHVSYSLSEQQIRSKQCFIINGGFATILACETSIQYHINIKLESSVSQRGHGCLHLSTKGTKSIEDNDSNIDIDSSVIY